jgi:hypothetical protein
MKLNDLKIKPKTCRECKQKFLPVRAIQPVCNDFKCMVAYANRSAEKAALAREKKAKREHKEKLEKAKTLTQHLEEAQRWFNKWVRLRDMKAGYGCISCGTKANVQYAAGHYRTRKAAPHLRFNPDNVWLQCNSYCNRHLSGNITEYRIELIKRIGEERVLALEHSNELHRYTEEEAKAIKGHYKKLCQLLEKGITNAA